MRWSSGFLKSSWMTLWSMYWTARSTLTRGTSSCSYCMQAIVPVASWSSVWSTRSAIGEPGVSSPSTRWSFRIWRERFSGMCVGAPVWWGLKRYLCSGGRRTSPVPWRAARRRPPRTRSALTRSGSPSRSSTAALSSTNAPIGASPRQVELEASQLPVEALGAERQRHRLLERRRQHAWMGESGRPLVVLLHEEAAAHPAILGLDLDMEAEDVDAAAPEAQIVVAERHRAQSSATRGVGSRPSCRSTTSPA